MMLGTAARSSMILDTATFMTSGAISARKIAIPRLIGTPMIIAIDAVTRVPRMYGRAPKPAAASQLTPVRNLKPKLVKAGKAPRTKTTIDSAMTPITEAAKTREPYLKKTSEEGCFKPSSNFSKFNRSDTDYWLQKTQIQRDRRKTRRTESRPKASGWEALAVIGYRFNRRFVDRHN